jgi:hypothetical protein
MKVFGYRRPGNERALMQFTDRHRVDGAERIARGKCNGPMILHHDSRIEALHVNRGPDDGDVERAAA